MPRINCGHEQTTPSFFHMFATPTSFYFSLSLLLLLRPSHIKPTRSPSLHLSVSLFLYLSISLFARTQTVLSLHYYQLYGLRKKSSSSSSRPLKMSRMLASTDAAGVGDPGVGEIMLFGVRVVVDSMRKSVSLNDLSQYEHPHEASNDNNSSNNTNSNAKDDVVPGYASENDVVHNSGGNRERERKRGIPWTEEEHKLFLQGLQKVGKGDWRGISRNFVKTRTPTQVASHAQKYFLRRSNHNRRRRRSSLFDITTDTVTASPMEEVQVHLQDNASQSHPLPPVAPPEPCNPSGFPLLPTFPVNVSQAVQPVTTENPAMQDLVLGQGHVKNQASSKLVRPFALHSIPHSTTIADLNLNLTSTVDTPPLSLKLSLPMDSRESSARHSAFQGMSNFKNGDSIITVA